MRFKIPGLRRAGVAAVAAITAATAFAALATPAQAASPPKSTGAWVGPPPAPNGISAVTQPVIVAGTSNSAAGNWTITVDAGSFVSGDFIAIPIDDSDNPATEPPGNCSSATDFVGFHAVPTVTVTSANPGAGVAQVTPSLAATTGCAANSRNDILVITFTNGTGTFPQQLLTVSGVAYDTGSAVSPGPVVADAEGCANGTGTAACLTADPDNFPNTNGPTGASNALITAVVPTANKPAVGLKPATGSQAISNIVLTETEAAAVPAGQVCVEITAPGGGPGVGTFWDPTSTPTVTATNGGIVNNGAGGPNGTSSGVTLGNTSTNPLDLTFNINSASASAGSYTISGLKVNTGTATGPVLVRIGVDTDADADACTGAPDFPIAKNLEIAAIVTINRIGGADRYGTAAALFSGFAVACNSTSGLNAVLSRGDLFADALSASYLAGSLLRTNGFNDGNKNGIQGAGILLTTPTALPDVTLAALRDAGVTDVFITGQTDAVSKAVEDQLKTTPAYVCGGTNQRVDANGTPLFLKITRIGGATRYDTAQMIGQSQTSTLVGTADVDGDAIPNPLRTAVVARGDNFPDALSAGPMAFYGDNSSNFWDDSNADTSVTNAGGTAFGTGAGSLADNGTLANGFPLFLTTPASLSPQAQAGLLNEGIQQVIVMGGTAAIAGSVDTQLQGLGIRVIRLAGADRSDTAAKAAAFETGTFADLPTTADTSDGRIKCDADGANDGDSDQSANTCTQTVGLFYRTDIVNIARGDDAGGGADALSGGPFAAGLVGAKESSLNSSSFEGPSPVLLALDPNTLGTTGTYLPANSISKVNADNVGPTPNGGINLATIFGQTAAISAATATSIQNALT